MIVRTGGVGSWHRADALRRVAEAAHAKGEDLRAADLWDRAFLKNLDTNIGFAEPQANLMIPMLIHRVRAQGLVAAGKVPEAVREAKLCLTNGAGDADAQIDVVNALRDAAHKAEADALYAQGKAVYAKLVADSPDSAAALNLLAWFEGRCGRDLDDALAHARKGVELEPQNTAILDTLAEVHFQRGEIDPALELVRKCLKLEPTSEHHRKNLRRFEAAKAAKGGDHK